MKFSCHTDLSSTSTKILSINHSALQQKVWRILKKLFSLVVGLDNFISQGNTHNRFNLTVIIAHNLFLKKYYQCFRHRIL